MYKRQGLRYSDFVSLNEKNIVKMDGKLWLIFDSVKTGACLLYTSSCYSGEIREFKLLFCERVVP